MTETFFTKSGSSPTECEPVNNNASLAAGKTTTTSTNSPLKTVQPITEEEIEEILAFEAMQEEVYRAEIEAEEAEMRAWARSRRIAETAEEREADEFWSHAL